MSRQGMRAFSPAGSDKPIRIWAVLAFFTLWLVLPISAPAADERRVALVIGNSDYRHTASLPNPKNDAKDISDALRRLHFEVIDGYNLGQSGMQDHLLRFARAAQDSDTALVFYAGHGLQYRGENYLVPTDAKLRDEIDLDFQTLRVEDLLRALERARGVRILILDACRNLPLASDPGRAADIFYGRGLAKIGRRGMVVAYATQANEVAFDGNDRNSFFTGALLQEIERPNVELGQMFRRVAASVNERTGGRQTPELSLSLTREFYFDQREDDREAWQRVRNSLDSAGIRAFIEKYPTSDLAEAARARLELLDLIARTTSSPGTNMLEGSREPRLALGPAPREEPRAQDPGSSPPLDGGNSARESSAQRDAAISVGGPSGGTPVRTAPGADQLPSSTVLPALSGAAARESSLPSQPAASEPDRSPTEVAVLQPVLPDPSTRTLGLTDPGSPDAPTGAPLLVRLQAQLKRLGCYRGEPSGRLDQASRSAIATFRHRIGPGSGDALDENLITLLSGLNPGVCTLECGGSATGRTSADCMVRWRHLNSPNGSQDAATTPKSPVADSAGPTQPIRCADILERAQLGEVSAADRVLLRDFCH